MIGMCKAKPPTESSVEMAELTPARSIEKKVDTSAECVLCEFAMNLLAKDLKSNKTEPELEALLRNVCNKRIPGKFRDQCNAFVDQYGTVIIDLLINEVDPEKICVAISLCPSSSESKSSVYNKYRDVEHLFKLRQRERMNKAAKNAVENNQPKKFFADDEASDFDLVKNVGNNTLQCSLCIYVAEMVDAALTQNKTEEQIVAELLLVCNLFPTNLKDQVKTTEKIIAVFLRV
jgi:hypothetical protein